MPIPPIPSDRYILITGVSGFVGEHLARSFSRHHEKLAGTFLTTPIQIPGVACLPLDATDERAVDRLIRDMRPAAVIHCAAQTNTSWCQQWPDEARAAIVHATGNLARAIANRAPDTPLIAFSTDLVFDGEQPPYDEAAAPAPLNVYGLMKSESEGAVLALPRGIVLRSALVYGPPGSVRSSFLSWMVESLARNQPLALFHDEWRTPVFVDDLAAAVVALIGDAESRGIYHAAGPDRLSREEMGRAVAQIFKLPEQPIHPSARSDTPTGNLRARDVSLVTARLARLGWHPTSFRDGLQACLARWNDLRSPSS